MTPTQQLLEAETGRVLVPRLAIARPFGCASLRGLLRRDRLDDEEGLLLADPLGCLHTIGMRFPIDIAFLSGDLRVRAITAAVPPRRIAWRPGCPVQVEVAAGRLAALGVGVGDRLAVGARAAGGSLRHGSPQLARAAGEPDHERDGRPCGSAAAVPSVRASTRRRPASPHLRPEEGRPCPQPCW